MPGVSRVGRLAGCGGPEGFTRGGRLLLLVLLVAAATFSAAGGGGLGQPSTSHATSKAYNEALGVGCEHCHDPSNPADGSKPTFDFARRMARMVQGLNAGPLLGFGHVDCWTCHRGRAKPARLPPERWQPMAEANRQAFLGQPDGVDVTMSVYAASLGVDCEHCHAPGDWKRASRRAHRLTTGRMLGIFELIPRYFDAAIRMPRTQCYMCHQGSRDVPHRS